uniref:Family with sequence similarity 210 member A n=1 Tax=Crocodylus porosus TaxID=8502 RepID=A0A7M4ELC4_CROPO
MGRGHGRCGPTVPCGWVGADFVTSRWVYWVRGGPTRPLPLCAAAEEALQSGCDRVSASTPLPSPHLCRGRRRAPPPPVARRNGSLSPAPRPPAPPLTARPRGAASPPPPSSPPIGPSGAAPRCAHRAGSADIVCGSDARRMRTLETSPPVRSGDQWEVCGGEGGPRPHAGLPGSLARGMRSALGWGRGGAGLALAHVDLGRGGSRESSGRNDGISSRGMNVVPILEALGLPENIISFLKNSETGNVLTAYTLCKIASPARYIVTLGGTSITIKYLRKYGYLSRPPPVKGYLHDRMEETKELLSGKMEETKDKITEKMEETRDKITEKMEETKGKITEKMEETKDKITEKMEETKDKITEKIQETKEKVSFKKRNE